ncbi:hypothetical protein V5799_034505 [Amblyomma americanum]|uniref:Uncharacterized protein n=1 Tax=Amblyomma americanum TaxID=6943 RepID=A0AAQ4DK96_AMBAM
MSDKESFIVVAPELIFYEHGAKNFRQPIGSGEYSEAENSDYAEEDFKDAGLFGAGYDEGSGDFDTAASLRMRQSERDFVLAALKGRRTSLPRCRSSAHLNSVLLAHVAPETDWTL